MVRIWFSVLAFIALFGCSPRTPATDAPALLVMGDSLFAWNRPGGEAVSDILANQLPFDVVDRSVIGARMRFALGGGLSIPDQFDDRKWDWVIVNGGGNDLWLGCGCLNCDAKLDRLISDDGRRGTIPGLLSDIRQSGARVIYVGYLRSPGAFSPIEHCRDEGDALETRLAKLDALDTGVYLVSLADLVGDGDRSFHAVDMIHPSAKGSAAIAERVTEIIAAERQLSPSDL